MIQSEEEYHLDKVIQAWREKEQAIKHLQFEADELKTEMISQMHALGLKSQETTFGKVTLSPVEKTNIIGSYKDPNKNRAEFEAVLRKHGLYDQLCETSLSMSKVRTYMKSHDDDLYGMVEVETNYRALFTPKGNE